MKVRIAVICALCALSLYLRTAPLDVVFQPGFVNFSETDAWFHVRMAENLVRHFPWRIAVDPYAAIGGLHPVAAGPLFDWVLALIAMIAGLGHPSEALLHTIAAWYPAILGMLIVPAVYLLGRDIFGERAGWLAAAAAATLPGHFLRVGSVGFTDHHVMESLLTALLLWQLARSHGIAAGLILGAYLLAFVGGAWLVTLIVLWAAFELIRGSWTHADPARSLRPVYIAFAIALVLVAPFYGVYWMGYTIAALGGGLVGLLVLDWALRKVSHTAVLVGMAIVAAMVAAALPFAWHTVLYRLAPSFANKSGAVEELQSLIYRNGHFSYQWMWQQFGGSVLLAVVGLAMLGEMAVRRPDPRRNLILFFGLATLVMSAGQLRMSYYFAIAVALLAGYVGDAMLDVKPMLRPVMGAALLAIVFAPNVWLALDATGTRPSISQDWREALDWMRTSTPEPFGNADYYYAKYAPPYKVPEYAVMSWWDYGYWIMTVGRRVPVSNPTQLQAEASAEFLLSQNEPDAAAVLEKWRARYVVVSHQMVLEDTDGLVTGQYGAYFEYARDRAPEQFYIASYQREKNGSLKLRILYLPAYYRSMAARLFLYGGAAVEHPVGAAIATLRQVKNYRELIDLRTVAPKEDAEAAAEACKSAGCMLVGVSPLATPVKLEGLTRFKQVFASSNPAVHMADGKERSIVQIYRLESNR